MFHISIGRILLKKETSRWRFFWYSGLSFLQARFSPGIVHASLYGDGSNTYWSMSIWRSREAMMKYRNSGRHRRAMQVSAQLAERIDFRHWEFDSLPDRRKTLRELRAQMQADLTSPPPHAVQR